MTEAVKRKRAALGLSATVYTPDDLEANEAGQLSEAQIERLRRVINARVKALASSLMIAIVVIVILITLASSISILLFLILAIMVFAGVHPIFELYDTFRKAVKCGQVKSISGPIQREIVQRTNEEVEQTWWFRVQNTSVQTDIATWSAVQPDALYTVFYTAVGYFVVLVQAQESSSTPSGVSSVGDVLQFASFGTREGHHEYRTRLMHRFRYTEVELQANQEGVRADSQHSKVWDQLLTVVLRGIKPLFVLWAVLGCMVLSLMMFGLRNERATIIIFNAPQEVSATGMQWALVAFFGVVLWTTWKLIPVVLDIFIPDVVIMDGIVNTPKVELTFRSSYSFTINGLEFPVNQPAYEILRAGDPYTVYFTPHSRTLLAIEWLGASPFKPEGSTPSPSH